MSSAAIVLAVQSILQQALPQATVLLGIPRTVNDYAVVYLYHQGYSDLQKTTGGNIQRTHTIPIHLLLQTAADDDQAELDLMAYNDAIADVFYTNRLLNNTVQTSQPHQQGVGAGSGQPAFINYGNIEYRHRWWTLDAIDYHAFVMK